MHRVRLITAAALTAAAVAPWGAPRAGATGTDHGTLVPTNGSPYATGATPYTVVAADLDGDGDRDVASTNINGSSVTVLRNDGAGGFTPATGSPFTAPHPADLAVANLNGDAYPDLVATRSEPNCCGNTDSLLTLLGTGNATFGAATQVTGVGFNVGPLAVGDVSGDGIPDAITTNTWVGADSQLHQQFSVYRGNGSGGWTGGTTTEDPDVAPNQTTLSDAVLRDVDGDTDLDLVLADIAAQRVTIWTNSGTGSFSRSQVVPLARQTGEVVPADFDHDGDTDLAVSGSNSGNIVLLLNNGAGTFASATWSPIDTGSLWPNYLTGSDVNNDGNLDLVGGGINQGSYAVYLGDGTGHFAEGWGSPYFLTGPKSLAGGDLNGDGYGDLAVVSNSTDTLRVALTAIDNTAPATSLVVDPPAPGSGWYTAAVNAAVLGTDAGSGVTSVRCAKDPGTPPATYAAMSACPASFAVSGDGVHHVYSAARDRAGNEGAVADSLVRIDGTAPTTSLVVDPPTPGSGWHTAAVSATVLGTDGGSGVTGVRCAADPGAPPASYAAMSACPASLGVSGDGVHHVYSAARDLAGNEGTVADSLVRMDGTPPQVTVQTVEPVPSSTWFSSAPTLDINVTDATSGVDELRCAIDPDPVPAAFDDLPACDAGAELGSGIHHVYAAASDVAGNTTTISTLIVKVDLLAPELAGPSVTPTAVRGNPLVVVPVVSDPHSGLADSGCSAATTAEVGEFAVMCHAVDVAGNEATLEVPYQVLPADLGVDLAVGKSPGAQLQVSGTVTSDGTVGASTVGFVIPSSLRIDSLPAGCTQAGDGASCTVAPMTTGQTANLTLLVSPRMPGPHPVSVSVATATDRDAGDNGDAAVLSEAIVCDNVATSGPDNVTGTSAADILCGAGGNDTFRGLAGDDLFFGGAGLDTVSYAGAPGTSVDLRSQGLGMVGAFARTGGGHGRDSFTEIERARGGSYADILIGSSLANLLQGGGGSDVLIGLGGVDRLEGQAGRDSLTGGLGRDVLLGGAGSDRCRERADVRLSCER